ncbi:response regulator transcription factor [Prosthecobacter sp.]|uniref:response regulator transcription factor n=1 Tax=Prosthecobacter sp. TaxID=1965333 RepID=UPI002AB8140A|nr:response regulator transcription factor [Prosthecobacter sp.]MDZ4402029.1 response regulator transcription factor [Prosthecobacter sp.]
MNEIWIVEDHAAFRRTLVRVLNAETGLQCTRDFDSCEKLLAALANDDTPDLILLDVGLPGMSGLDGIRLIKERAPKTLVVILTVFEDDDKVFQAICAGAAGYLLKTSSATEIIQAVRDALTGGSPMTSRIARRVLDMFSKFAPKQSDYGLSEREKEILQLMTTGLIKKEIADRLTLSIHTVDTYLRRIYEKLEVNTRTGAVAKALKEGLV